MKKKAGKSEKKSARSTIDADEVHQFDSLSGQWWDETGALKSLHRLNPVRVEYLRRQICARFHRDTTEAAPLGGLRIVDIGCGGGLVAEPLCRLGAVVTGVDAGDKSINAAKTHARRQKLNIDYKVTTAEQLAAKGEKFDAVIALEILEHVSDPALFLSSCCKLAGKNGILVLSTLNRTPKSFMLGIVAAEYLLHWAPKGSHDWRKFVRPSEIVRPLAQEGFEPVNISGIVYDPLLRRFGISEKDIDVNYFLTAVRKSEVRSRRPET
ncbi:MAG: bifunctional 2-polyprenyl-6-hydroxyphenol methylase/3-demethylubiquinol 3-O-methyltransferase UbiG [Pseudomonadota bacterium]